MKKKAIVLLITIFFIVAISILIEKNLKTTDKFINIKATNTNMKQLELSINDINREILKIFNDKDANLLVDLPPMIPFSYGNVEVKLHLSDFSSISHYRLDNTLVNKTDDLFRSHVNVNQFLEIIKDKNITNQNQIDFVVDEYIAIAKNDDILKIKDRFISFDANGSNYISCKYDVVIDGLNASVDMVFQANTKNQNTKPIKLEIKIKR